MKSSASKRFAKALIEVGKEEGAWDRYGKELRTVIAVFRGNPELEERKALMDSVAASTGLSAHVAKFLDILVETRNIRFIEDIAEAYSRFEDAIAGRIRATVESPAELSQALAEEIRTKLSATTGKEVILTCKYNPELLGGLVLRIDNTILDGSLKTQLELMKEKILEGVV